MYNALAFGTYVQGKSRVHQMNAQVKIILACVFSIGAFFVTSWAGMCLFLLVLLLGYALSGIKVSKALGGIRPVLLILLFTVAAHAVSGGAQSAPPLFPWESDSLMSNAPAMTLWGGLTLSAEGLVSGLFFAARIALLVAACCLLTFTTSQVQITGGLKSMLEPLARLRIPVDDVCLVISMALRFVPTVTEEAYALRRSLESRCVQFEGAGPIVAMKSWGRVFVPLFVRLFLRADRLAVAMDARCYGGGQRSTLKSARLSGRSVVACVVISAAVVGIAILL